MKIPTPKCNRCGAEAPVDTNLSNKNWVVYQVKEPCECGGRFEVNFSERTDGHD